MDVSLGAEHSRRLSLYCRGLTSWGTGSASRLVGHLGEIRRDLMEPLQHDASRYSIDCSKSRQTDIGS